MLISDLKKPCNEWKEADILQDWANGGLFRLTRASPAISVLAGAQSY
ncbi:MAG: hypothetical protein CM1200mP30_29710 [Pseudomonadota bacterium]|nr:MAG: hypothetical protein CM1200mP30_29710 [Pseudomonadota bacterium]